MNEEQIQTLLQEFVFDPWNNGNLDALDGVVASGYRLGEDGTIDDLKQAITEARSDFPDLTVTVDDIVAADDKVAYRWTMRATHTHEYEGIPATGRGITITGITFLRLEEGRIVDDRFESGSPSPAEQLAGT